MKRCFGLLLCALLLITPSVVHAETPKNRGLLISPLRNYVSVDASSHKTNTFTVANLTEKAMTVNLSIKQFSVNDYAYDYRFSEPDNDWLHLQTTQVVLQPSKSQSIVYDITVPASTPGGGRYYTLLASANVSNDGLASTVQAASLLYLTVKGTLIRTSQLQSSQLPHFFFDKTLNYELNVKNTGNVHYFAYFAGELEGFSARPANGTSHLLLPGAIRTVSGSIRAPLLPGVYRATYGYQTDAGTIVSRTERVLFIPPWSVVLVLLLGVGGYKLHRFRSRHASAKQAAANPAEKP